MLNEVIIIGLSLILHASFIAASIFFFILISILITGILTDKSIAYASAKVAIENGATVVATGFGKGLRITARAVKRISDEIKVYEMDIENQDQVNEDEKK